MERIVINSCGIDIMIETDIGIKEFIEKNVNKTNFPNLKVREAREGEECKNILQYKASDNRKEIKCEENRIFMEYPKEKLTPSNIFYMSRYLLEKELADQGKMTTHSACIEKNGKAVLVLGEAGSGKTSLALNLCMREGYTLISNDQTVIGMKGEKLFAFEGTKFLNLRYSSIKENLPELVHIFGKDEVENWAQKVTVQASDIGIEEQNNETEIDQVIQLHVDNREKDVKETKGDNWRNNFLLYQNLTENIRNTNSTAVDKEGHPIGYVPSYDNEERYNKRIEVIDKINSNPKYRYLSGNLEEIIINVEGARKEKEYEREL